MSTRLIEPFQSYLDSNGDPLNGGLLYFYIKDTTTPKDTHSDAELSTLNTNPIVLNSAGRPDVDVWGSGEYKLVVKNSAGITQATYNPLLGYDISGAIYFNTVALMTDTAKDGLVDDQIYGTKGYASIGDDGGGLFYWDEASTATAIQGYIIASDEGGNGRFVRVGKGLFTIQAFGALGGATDDTAAFQAAIDSGRKTITVPYNADGYTINSITNTDTTFMFLGGSALNGSSAFDDLKGVVVENGGIGINGSPSSFGGVALFKAASIGNTTVHIAHNGNATGRIAELSLASDNTGYVDRGIRFQAIEGSGVDVYTGKILNDNVEAIVISSSANVNIPNALSKGSGSFKINHPLPSMKDTHHLVHSFTESPQADLVYSGMVNLVNGLAEINIDLVSEMTEGTFELLCGDVRRQVSNESGFAPLISSISGNILSIQCQDDQSTDEVFWMVIGERKDEHILNTNWTDDNGHVIVEPLKNKEI